MFHKSLICRLMFVTLFAIGLLQVASVTAQEKVAIQYPGRSVYLNLPDLSAYQHSRGEITLKFPLYVGKKWNETVGDRHTWTVVVKVLRINTVMSNGTADLQAHFQVSSSPWGYGEDGKLEDIGVCIYSSVKRAVISCS